MVEILFPYTLSENVTSHLLLSGGLYCRIWTNWYALVLYCSGTKCPNPMGHKYLCQKYPRTS